MCPGATPMSVRSLKEESIIEGRDKEKEKDKGSISTVSKVNP
jgi:hypothetical protein